MPMRSSSLANNPLAITRELDGRYDVVLGVRDALPEIERLLSLIDEASTVYTIETIEEFTTVPSWFNTVIVKDINRGGTFVAKTNVDIDPNTGSVYTVNGGTVFAKSGGGFWVRQYSGAVNVKWFGAKGDGVTDDTVAIQRALNSSSMIFIPAGTYKINNELQINPNSKLYGSKNAILKRTGTTTQRAIKILGSNIEITGLSIVGSQETNVTTFYTNNTAIYNSNDGNDYSNIYIHEVEIYGFGDGGIGIFRPKDCLVENCYIHDVGRYGVFYYGGYNSHIKNNTIKNITVGSGGNAPFINAYGLSFTCDTNQAGFPRPEKCSATGNHIENIPNWEALDTHGGKDILFENNTVVDCMIGVFVGPASGTNNQPCDGVSVINNTFTTNTTLRRAAVIIAPTYDVGNIFGYGFIVSGNKIKGYGVNQATYEAGYTSLEGAIHVIGARGVVVDANQIYAFNNIGIYIRQFTQGCSVADNSIVDGSATNNIVYGMAFETPSDSMVTVSSNTIQRTSGVLNGVYVIGTPVGKVYGIRFYQDNSLINLTSDFEASSRERLHRKSGELLSTKAYAYIINNGTSAVLSSSVGIASVVRNSTGNVTVNLSDAAPFTTYSVFVTPRGGSARYATVSNNYVNSFNVFAWNNTGELVDLSFYVEVRY